MTADELAGRAVTVVGLGRFGGGVGVTRWLADRGARVTVSDQADADTLAESIDALQGRDVTLHLGAHDEADFLDADLLVVSPAVRPDHPLVADARQRGVEITSEMNLFLQRCRGRLVGITGTVGKSTITAMTGAILSRNYRTFVGGNIGVCLLDRLEEIDPGDVVVLELSSFQLEVVGPIAVSPGVALVSNLMPNHLDRHGTMDAYADAKRNIYRFQQPGDVLILNTACEVTRHWAIDAPGRVDWFDPAGEPFELPVPGRHNQANAQSAWAIARQFNVDRAEAASALAGYQPLPHRLQPVAAGGGVTFYNDSKCTTPEGAMVALEAFPARGVVLIVGGYDKGVSFDALGQALADRAKAVVCIGATGSTIAAAVEARRSGDAPTVVRPDDPTDFAQAVTLAAGLACPGDAVLLSPACASYDMFTHYQQRGEAFADLARQWTQSPE